MRTWFKQSTNIIPCILGKRSRCIELLKCVLSLNVTRRESSSECEWKRQEALFKGRLQGISSTIHQTTICNKYKIPTNTKSNQEKTAPPKKKKQQEGEKEKEGEDILSDEEEDNLERVLQLPYPSKKEWLISKGKRLKDNTKENTLIIYIKKYFKDRRF